MSELKVYHCDEWHNPHTEFYLRHEADRVLRKERHKRCMRLVDWCRSQYNYYKCEYDYDEGFGDAWLRWMRWCKKWESRWLAIAAKYEEVSKC